MKHLLIIASLIAFIAPPSFAQQIESEIPFTFEKGHIIVAAKIKDKEPVEMAIATGLERSVVAAENIQKHKLRVLYTAVGPVTGRNDKADHPAEVTDIHLGNTHTSRLLMPFNNGSIVNIISKNIGREIFAVLGADFFKGRIVQFDFKKKVIRFLTNWKAPKEGSERVAILPMLVDNIPTRRPIVERVSFTGKPIKTLLDTGSVTVISLTPTGAKEVGLPVPSSKSDPQAAKVSLALEKISFPDVPAVVYPKDSSFDKESSGYSAMIGIAVLQNFTITFDFSDAVVVLER